MADLGAIGVYNGGFFHTPGKTISGTVYDSAGLPARRQVMCFLQASDPNTVEKSAYSDPVTGAFTMPMGDTVPRTLMAVGEPGKNNIVYTGVVPV